MAEETLARIRFPLPAVLHAREVSLVAERLCTCSQSTGRHALACPTLAAVRGNGIGYHLGNCPQPHGDQP